MPFFTWGLNKSRTEHKASLPAARLYLPEGKEAAKPDRSPCPLPATPSAWEQALGSGSHRAPAPDPAADCVRCSSWQQIPEAEGFIVSNIKMHTALCPPCFTPGSNLTPRKPPSQPLHCNLGSSTCSRVTHCRDCSALWSAGTRGCC